MAGLRWAASPATGVRPGGGVVPACIAPGLSPGPRVDLAGVAPCWHRSLSIRAHTGETPKGRETRRLDKTCLLCRLKKVGVDLNTGSETYPGHGG